MVKNRYLDFRKHIKEIQTTALDLRSCFLISMGCIGLRVQEKAADFCTRSFHDAHTASILHNSTFECCGFTFVTLFYHQLQVK